MAQRTTKALRTSPAASARPVVTTATLDRRPGRDFAETIWTLFCSLRFAVVLNVALALAAMTGTVIPQMQPGIQNFETDQNTFLDAARGRYGDLTGFLYW